MKIYAFVKRLGKFILILIGILFIAILGAEWWLELKFEGLVNANPNSKYEISFEDLDFKSFFKGVTLEEMRISPRDSTSTQGTMVFGSMEYADIEGISWLNLFLGKRASVQEMTFIQPQFEIYLRNDTTREEKAGASFQDMFKDVLARAELSEFNLLEGSVSVVRIEEDTIPVGRIATLTIEADELETDSVQLGNLIPFKLKGLYTTIEGIEIDLSPNTNLQIGGMYFDSKKEVFELKNVSMGFAKDWVEISQDMGIQTDLISFDLKSLQIHNLGTKSSLYGELDIEATQIIIDSLVLKDNRNKNVPRPADAEKPMFLGMVNAIAFPMKVDSIIIRNSTISYTELGEGKDAPGTLTFGDINGKITRITTYPDVQQAYESFEARLFARLNNQAPMNMHLVVPYNEEKFYLDAQIAPFDATILNPTTIPLASVKIDEGDIRGINLSMTASRTMATNTLSFDFQNLGISVIQADGEEAVKKRGVISGLANSLIRHQNLAGEKNYKKPTFTSSRNIYRGPFNFMWQSVKEGMVLIVPSNTAGALIPNKDKKKKKKQ